MHALFVILAVIAPSAGTNAGTLYNVGSYSADSNNACKLYNVGSCIAVIAPTVTMHAHFIMLAVKAPADTALAFEALVGIEC